MTQENQPDLGGRIGRVMYYVAAIALLFLLESMFSSWQDSRENPNRGLSVGDGEVVLERNAYGHYVADGKINGQPVTFLLDTGATGISVPQSVADRVGLRGLGESRVRTANGVVSVSNVVLDSVSLGSITQYRVDGHINPHMGEDTVLLGMSFMKRLELIQRGDQLTLRQY